MSSAACHRQRRLGLQFNFTANNNPGTFALRPGLRTDHSALPVGLSLDIAVTGLPRRIPVSSEEHLRFSIRRNSSGTSLPQFVLAQYSPGGAVIQ
jgi:hypothetical protein